MSFIDTTIYGTTLLGSLYVAASFISFVLKRVSSSAAPVNQDIAHVEVASQVEPDPVAEALEQVEAAYKGIDTVVPFKRPTKAEPTDAELIQFAKSIKFPGSGKWAKTRKLSPKVRSELTRLARQSA